MCDPHTIASLRKGHSIMLDKNKEYAAVSIVIHHNKIVIEKRISSPNDPWSGQFSLPGGHFESTDINLLNTVIRETNEETGIDLKDQADHLGYFGPFSPGNAIKLDVYVFVFLLSRFRSLVVSPESEALYWADLQKLEENGRYGGSYFEFEGGNIWGLTARILREFFLLCSSNI